MQAKETTLLKMLSGTKVFLVPLFQRRYKWGGPDWSELWEDVLAQYDDPDVSEGRLRPGEGHFLGSIVLHPAPGPASTVTRYLVVDGQQRLTTLLILIAVLRDARKISDPNWDPNAYDQLYLGNPFSPEHPYRLIPTARDREAFVDTVYRGSPAGQPGRAYKYFQGRLAELGKRPDGLDFARIELAILLRLLVVDIATSPGDNVNHIFHTLNHAGQKLSPLDLVRNRVFMSLGDGDVNDAYDHLWQPMELNLGDDGTQRYLWAQVARSDPKATQKDLYPAFDRRLARLESANRSSAVYDELTRLHEESGLYGAIVQPPALEAISDLIERDRGLPREVVRRLHDLRSWGSSTHIPLTLEALSRLHAGAATESQVVRTLDWILSFLVRRALCAIPTNNLNRIFTSLPSLLDEGPIDDQVARMLASEQRYWPSDEEVFERVRTTPIYATAQPAQVKFILERLEWEIARNEAVDTSLLEIEHVLPQKPTREWLDYLASVGDVPERTLSRIHTLGNLTLTGYNPELARLSFERKRNLYSDSLVRLTESIASATVWSELAISDRSDSLARIAVGKWTRPQPTANRAIQGELESRGSVRDLLMRMAAEDWTTLDALSEYLAIPREALMRDIEALDPVLGVKVLDESGEIPSWVGSARRGELVTQFERGGVDGGPPYFDTPKPLGVDGLRRIEELGVTPSDELSAAT